MTSGLYLAVVCGVVVSLAHSWCPSSPLEARILESVPWDSSYSRKVKEGSRRDGGTNCKSPVPKIIPVKNLLKDAGSEIYEPQCVKLHQCDGTAGCCKEAGKTCAAAKTEIVAQYFRMKGLKNGETLEWLQKISFVNHISCECTAPVSASISACGVTPAENVCPVM